jgi:hypothetical protein
VAVPAAVRGGHRRVGLRGVHRGCGGGAGYSSRRRGPLLLPSPRFYSSHCRTGPLLLSSSRPSSSRHHTPAPGRRPSLQCARGRAPHTMGSFRLLWRLGCGDIRTMYLSELSGNSMAPTERPTRMVPGSISRPWRLSDNEWQGGG